MDRKKITVIFYAGKAMQIFEGKTALDFIASGKLTEVTEKPEETREVIGQIASLGKATGKIIVALTSEEAKSKAKEGTILVAKYTDPTYVPAMGKCSAIVTETGGVTSHAAVISRELGIPCVIGVKNATKIFKDGDLVEVDANTGIIKVKNMGMEEVERIKQLLAGSEFECFEHEEVRTSEEAARVRKSKLSEGVKAIVLKERNNSRFIVANVPADKRVELKELARTAGCSSLTMASAEEVLEKTGCVIGGVPPLGHKEKLEIFVDPQVFENEYNEFNAGMRTVSIRVKASDFKKALLKEGAKIAEISKM